MNIVIVVAIAVAGLMMTVAPSTGGNATTQDSKYLIITI